MRKCTVIMLTVLVLLKIGANGQSFTNSLIPVKTTRNIIETLQCYRHLQEMGKRIHVRYDRAPDRIMRIFDEDGVEVSCDKTEQQILRMKSDRRCKFSPIHCLFNKRINTANLLAKLSSSTDRMYRRK